MSEWQKRITHVAIIHKYLFNKSGRPPGERPEHSAYQHLRKTRGIEAMGAQHESMLRRVAAGYFGLITHLDEQIGAVMDALKLEYLTFRHMSQVR